MRSRFPSTLSAPSGTTYGTGTRSTGSTRLSTNSREGSASQSTTCGHVWTACGEAPCASATHREHLDAGQRRGGGRAELRVPVVAPEPDRLDRGGQVGVARIRSEERSEVVAVGGEQAGV